MADTKAILSPKMSSAGDLLGNVDASARSGVEEEGGGTAFSVFERSDREIRMIPRSEASTPRSFRTVNFSTRAIAPMMRVQTDEVEVRIVALATVVCSRQAMAKMFARNHRMQKENARRVVARRPKCLVPGS